MRLLYWSLIGAIAIWGAVAAAQTFPEPRNTIVNDYADMLPAEAEARITKILSDLAQETGAQATIVTLSSVRFYAQNLDVPEYATALFNAWGVGDADKGDGILLIVFRDDQELRLQLGEGYDADAQARAKAVVSDTIVPDFMNDQFVDGIEAGALAIADRVVRNTQADIPSSAPDGAGGNILYYILGGIVAGGLALFGLNKRAKAKLAATPCSNCGVAGQLSKDRNTLAEATETTEGQGETTTTCGACGHIDRDIYSISKKRPKEEETFEGGKTKGNGATGKW